MQTSEAPGPALWTLVLVAGVVGLRALGSGPLATPTWDDLARLASDPGGADTLIVAFALLRVGALAIAAYLLGLTVLVSAARWLRVPVLAALARRLVLPGARHLLPAALVLGLAGPWPTAPALARPAWPAPDRAAPPFEVRWAGPAPPAWSPVTLPPVAPPPTAAEPRPAAGAAEQQWTVASGEHFWSIAGRVLGDHLARAPATEEVGDYWRRLVAANADRLVDAGNPDLLYPGQQLRVPRP
jgi:hypothetical protein